MSHADSGGLINPGDPTCLHCDNDTSVSGQDEKMRSTHYDRLPADDDIELDIEKRESQEAVVALEVQYTAREEAKVVRKLDFHILSVVSVLYLLSYLDRGNIGNANAAGMSEDLHIGDPQYEWFLTIFYISYITFQWMSLLWKLLPPRIYVPCVVVAWGVFSTCGAAVQNWSQMMALRFFMGACEAGFVGVPYYLSFFYYRHELAFRTGLWLSVSPLASAFAGALAYGITEGHLVIESWRVLFLVEGLPTIVMGAATYFLLPNDAGSCRFLNDRETQIAIARTVRQSGRPDRGGHRINWKEVAKSCIDIKNLIPMLMYFSINVSFSSLPVFTPTILKGMGFTSIRAQGLSAPPYLVTFFLVIILSYISDRILQRGILIVIMASIGAAGFLILAVCEVTGVKYFALFLATGGVFPCVALTISWLNNNNASDSKRGAGFVIMQLVGQCGPLLGTRLFPASEGPHYKKGFYVCFSFLVLLACLALTLRTYLQVQNKKLDEKHGMAEGDPRNPQDAVGLEGEGNINFRYIL